MAYGLKGFVNVNISFLDLKHEPIIINIKRKGFKIVENIKVNKIVSDKFPVS